MNAWVCSKPTRVSSARYSAEDEGAREAAEQQRQRCLDHQVGLTAQQMLTERGAVQHAERDQRRERSGEQRQTVHEQLAAAPYATDQRVDRRGERQHYEGRTELS